MRVGLAVVVLALVRAGARAQNTTAKCAGDFSWSFNNLAQSPCLVAAYLLAPCSPGGGRVSALPAPGLTYNPPAPDTALVANECTCSTVTYSALQACALCQAGSSVSWSHWSTNCGDSQMSIRSYPKPVNGTRLPQWLFQDVAKSGTFDVSTAEQVAASTLPDQEGGIPPAATPTRPVKPVDKSSNAVPLAEIIAGVIGGIATLLILAIIGTCLWRRRKQKKDDQLEAGARQHSRGKSLEDIIISKPLPPEPAPNTGSSFGPPGPAPWPTSSETGKAASGWPQGPATPRGANPIPVSLTLQSPDGERRVRIQEGNGSVISPTVSAPRSETGTARQLAPQTGPPRTTSPRLVAGPVPQARYDPEDPRTWPPTAPPPRKLQIKMQGLPATPRQKRAVRVNSRDDGQARYPTPQLGEKLELDSQPRTGAATRYPGPALVIPPPRSAAGQSPSSSQTALVTPVLGRSPSSRMGHSPSHSDSRAGLYSPASSRGDLPATSALHTRSQSSSQISRMGHSPTPALTSRPSDQSLYAQSPSSAMAPSPSSRRGPVLQSPASSQSSNRYALSPGPRQNGPGRYAHSATSSTSSAGTARYKSPSEILALERSGSASTAGGSSSRDLYSGQRLTVAPDSLGPSRRR